MTMSYIYSYVYSWLHSFIFKGSDCITGEKKNITSSDTVKCKCMLFMQIDVRVNIFCRS